MTRWLWSCRCRVEPVICFLDEWAHRLHIPARRLCDRHDDNIRGEFR